MQMETEFNCPVLTWSPIWGKNEEENEEEQEQ
jgi:hypothetical protein